MAASASSERINWRAIETDATVPLASSGPTETAVDLVVARCFKARGLNWYRRGVSAFVRLRLLRLIGTLAPLLGRALRGCAPTVVRDV